MSLSALREAARLLRQQVDRPMPEAHQRPPEGDWRAWVLAAGRGGGKTFATMHWLADLAEQTPRLRARIIAPTFGDAVASCVNGPNGLLVRSATAQFKPSEPGGAVVRWPNGASVWLVGTPTLRDVDRLRALTNIDVDVFEEAAANAQLAHAWAQASLSRRGSGIGVPIRWAASTTPRPLEIIKQWKADPLVHYVQAPSSVNKHADKDWLAEQERLYAGTRLYRQEMLGEILEDVIGALWKLSDIERSTVTREEAEAAVTKVVIGVDPPSGPGTCGIVVVGKDQGGHLYVLDDYSVTDATPEAWAQAVSTAYKDWDSPLVVAEVNQGGRMVTSVLRTAHPGIAVTTVHAAKGKQARAEPVAVRWEATEQTAHMAGRSGSLAKLIDQLTTWGPGEGESPDRLDAMVWAATKLGNQYVGEPRVSAHANRRAL